MAEKHWTPDFFALTSSTSRHTGSIVTATLRYLDIDDTGRVAIQGRQVLGGGRFRYGVHCVDKAFRATIHEISKELQRQQLRRLACRV